MDAIERVDVFWHNAKYDKPRHHRSVWVTVAPETQEHGGSVIRASWDGQFWQSLTYDKDGGDFYKIPSRMYPGMEVKAWTNRIPSFNEDGEDCNVN